MTDEWTIPCPNSDQSPAGSPPSADDLVKKLRDRLEFVHGRISELRKEESRIRRMLRSVGAGATRPGKSSSGQGRSDLLGYQKTALPWLAKYISEHGHGPRLRELSDFLGVSGNSQADAVIKALVRKGYIEKIGGPQGIRIRRMPGEAE